MSDDDSGRLRSLQSSLHRMTMQSRLQDLAECRKSFLLLIKGISTEDRPCMYVPQGHFIPLIFISKLIVLFHPVLANHIMELSEGILHAADFIDNPFFYGLAAYKNRSKVLSQKSGVQH